MKTISKCIAALFIGASAGFITAIALDLHGIGKFRLGIFEWVIVAFVAIIFAVVAAVRFSQGHTLSEEFKRFMEASSSDDLR